MYEIAKNSAQIGNEILKVNYNKIQKISSKGRKGDLVTNVDLEVENKIKEYLLAVSYTHLTLPTNREV